MVLMVVDVFLSRKRENLRAVTKVGSSFYFNRNFFDLSEKKDMHKI